MVVSFLKSEQNMSEHLWGNAPEFQAVLRSSRVVAATDVSVLITGESGTGKELLARDLHKESRRAKGPFVAINCAALPETLAESTLFGHLKGAFTGAIANQTGSIRAAEGGTLFLDEIGEIPLSIQPKLLRFLESGETQAVGSPAPERVDVRVVAATNRDLLTQVREGKFRADLYYRLNVVPLALPPLREREGDIKLLLERFISQFAREHQLSAPQIDAQAFGLIEQHPWPGNVRELRNLCERLVVLCSGKTVRPGHLPTEILTPESGGGEKGMASPFHLPAKGISLEQLEKDLIHQALEKTRGNKTRAARLLGLTRDTFLYRIKKYALPI
ncbi:MAG: sigma 54-interacting transcriptional regulator [Magnetococcales bacterium]|nr:sigma 54-interacting transcriptional regulator [Magnetococcales bacterium]